MAMANMVSVMRQRNVVKLSLLLASFSATVAQEVAWVVQ